MSGRLESWLWLANGMGYAPAHSADFLAAWPDPDALYAQRDTADTSLYLTAGQRQVLGATEPEDFIARIDNCNACDVKIVTFDSPLYPPRLRDIPSAPPVLYYRGDITVPGRMLPFAIVGTRRPSSYGVEATRLLAQQLAKAGVALVSGLATGLDSECHKAAVNAGTPTVAVIAFGHDFCYPASNRTLKRLIEQQGLVISEYPPGTAVQKQYFIQRNRLIAGLSAGLCVAEARRASGTMHTVNDALNYGRDVFAVPGSIFSAMSEGTNALLREGAAPATCGADILRAYGIDADAPPPKSPPDLSGLSQQERHIYAALSQKPQPLAEVAQRAGVSPSQAMAALTRLELEGLVSQQAGRQFVRND